MSTRGSSVMATGFAILLLALSTAIGSSGFGLLVSLVGVLAGANLIAVGVHDPAPIAAAVFAGVGALTALLRRNLAAAGLIMASSAVTAIAGEAGPALCFAMFALLLLGISLVTTGFLGA
uniref:Uncharacterized protein n=1 Tax=Arundo donax TaxID=35708 RepID=A0A0A9B767_ARUDO